MGTWQMKACYIVLYLLVAFQTLKFAAVEVVLPLI